MIHDGYANAVVVAESVRRLLDLRETLVRFDENLKAYWLLRQAPFFCGDHPAVVEALDQQYAMVKHVLPADELRAEDRDADPYESYYATNPHELRFERQYGVGIDRVHELPRVQFLRMGLKEQTEGIGVGAERPRVLDLGCNDGFMAARLALDGYTCDGVDLHPGNIEIALERKQSHPEMGVFQQGAIEDAPAIVSGYGDHVYASTWKGDHDAVVGFETIEHVRDPHVMLAAMRACCKPGGALYVSTPNGAVEGGNLPTWAHVEPKGHVRVYTADTFRQLLGEYGTVDRFELGPDGVLCARVRP